MQSDVVQTSKTSLFDFVLRTEKNEIEGTPIFEEIFSPLLTEMGQLHHEVIKSKQQYIKKQETIIKTTLRKHDYDCQTICGCYYH